MLKNGSDKENHAKQPESDEPNFNLKIQSQFIRDLSFENLITHKNKDANIQQDIDVHVDLDVHKHQEKNTFTVSTKYTVKSISKSDRQPIFILELDYAGLFIVDGIPENQLHPFLFIECPRLLFPYARRIISDITHDSGLRPLNLEHINFVQIYRKEINRKESEKVVNN
ncbi:MAG: protein-export chaperone SecB [Aestuariivita sp.]|nr:protein-export chaperone SecB [Aestuariivita sp.]